MLGWLFYGLFYVFIHTMIRIGWWRMRAEGWEHLPPRDQGGMIAVMNHVNWVDIPSVGALLPFSYRLSWLAKSELFSNPVASWWFRTMNVIPVNRGRRDRAAIEGVLEALHRGQIVLIFPEGHRSRNAELQKGHTGAIRLAQQSGVPIIPMAIYGSQYGLRGILRRQEIMLRIGPAYTLGVGPNQRILPDQMEQLTTDMMVKIAQLLPSACHGVYRQALMVADEAR
ncbi:MAG: 1-acyl-sn-glycerol-3-phosphate acyltransferase [Chloroflexaceae bacterium]|nr:1-acyl-sn-glycerol-3-phosphate acyltransferase [Chloroflexaceae bacterium]